ncbi:MAG TPA: ferritin family protein [bacterium]
MDTSKIISGLQTALQTELNGIQFYRIASEKTEDIKAKSVFKILAEDEARHFVELKKKYDQLLLNGTWAKDLTLGNPSSFDGKSPIFSDELQTRIQDRHFEMSALSIAALLESNSVDLYRKMMDEANEDNARSFFQQLYEWEQKHLAAISKQMDLLKEEYWAQAKFTPLF